MSHSSDPYPGCARGLYYTCDDTVKQEAAAPRSDRPGLPRGSPAGAFFSREMACSLLARDTTQCWSRTVLLWGRGTRRRSQRSCWGPFSERRAVLRQNKGGIRQLGQRGEIASENHQPIRGAKRLQVLAQQLMALFYNKSRNRWASITYETSSVITCNNFLLCPDFTKFI